jgi:hypothetical protein
MPRSWKTLVVVALALILTVVALARGPLKNPLQAALSAKPADGYRYTKSEGTTLLGGDGRYQISIHFKREIWIGSDGSGRMIEWRGDPTYFGTNDKVEWQNAPFDELVDEVYEPKTLTYLNLNDLPRDPSALRAHLLQRADPKVPAASEVFTQARSYLWETVPPSDLARAFRQVLIAEPGIAAEGVEGAGGRVKLSLLQGSPPELKLSMTLDEAGGLVHEERTLLVTAPTIDAAPPVSIGITDYLAASLVDHLSAP